MKKQNILKTSMALLLFFAFAYAQAGFIPVVSTTPTCHSSDGSVTITGTGDAGPFGFHIWNNQTNQADSNIVSSATFTGLAPGNYQYFAYSQSGNYQSGTFTVSPLVDIVISTTQPLCPSGTTGSATALISGGTIPYTYLWSNGLTTQTVTGLNTGINLVTVTDANGCFASGYDTVEIVSPVNCTITHSGPACSGTLTAVPTGGTLPYTFFWTNNATTSSISNLTSGTSYAVNVTDANGCQSYGSSFVINSGLAFDTINAHATNPTCGANGSISVAMASGTAPFTYAWSNGATGATISGLVSGYYYVTATDANGCTGSNSNGYYLYGNPLNQQSYVGNPSCDTAYGYIELIVNGGSAPYSYGWSNGATTSLITNLGAGTYYDTITDATGCSLIDSTTLIRQGNFTAQVIVSPILCPTTTGGSMTVNVTGGPYTYLWSNGATTQTISNLTEGTHFSVIVTDGSGCQAEAYSDSVTSVAPFSITLNATACGNTVTSNITGSTGPYTYLWSTGQTTTSITFAQYGSYQLTVTDAHGCSAYQNFYNYTSGIQLDSFSSQVNPTCTTLGGIKATPLNGVAPYTYLWSNSATTDSIGGLNSGYYQVTVTDANGCSGAGYYYLSQNSISAYAESSYPTCGSTNGSITLSPSGGTAPYAYVWGNSSTNHTATESSLGTGTYTFTVTDASGCTFTGSDVLTALGNYTVTIATTPTSCNPGLPTGAVTPTVTNGGTAPFTFSWEEWSNSTGSYFDTTTSGELGGLPYGTNIWLQSVVDANGCRDSGVAYIPADSGATYIDYASSCYDDITGYAYTDLNGNCVKNVGEPGNPGINIEAVGSNGVYYANTDSSGFYDIQVLPGTYTVTAYTYSGGSCNESSCTSSYTPTLTGTGAVSSGNNFGYTNGAAFDLTLHTGYSPSTPGTTKQYWVYYYNQGATAVNNAVLTFVHDPNLVLASTNPTYSSYDPATQTITWNLGTVPVSNWINWSQEVTMEFNVPSNLALGTLLSASDSITPAAGDCNPANNAEFFEDIVSGSHDPNSKEVSPTRNIAPGDSVLNYTIRFQNTGNAPATRIVIVDTLSPLVNPASLVVGASNFPYTYTLSGNGIITFTFYPIHLPDSAQAADSSIGFVSYSVTIRSGNAIGSQIKNTASIYFDQNAAVVTNTTVTTITQSTVGIKNIDAGDMSVTVSPNPVHDKSLFSIEGATGEISFAIEDVAGQKIFEKTTTSSEVVFESNSFAAGIYIYTARDIKGNTCTGKIVVAH